MTIVAFVMTFLTGGFVGISICFWVLFQMDERDQKKKRAKETYEKAVATAPNIVDISEAQ